MSKLFDDASLAMIPSAYKDGKLYSIRPTDGSGDFTFSRGSNLAATRVDVNGLIEKGRENVLTYSNDFSNAIWVRHLVGVVGNQADKDGGTNAFILIANVSAGSKYIYNSDYSSTKLNTGSFYVKYSGYHAQLRVYGIGGGRAYANFDLQNGTKGTSGGDSIVDSTITSVGNDWYRVTLTINHSGSYNVGIGPIPSPTSSEHINFAGDGTSGIYIQDAQLEQGLVATDYIETGASTAQAGILEDMPRLDYSGGASCPSLLLEPQRTNSVLNSEYYAGYPQTRITLTHNAATSPEGVDNATKMVETTDTGLHFLSLNGSVTSSSNAAFSIFAKQGENQFLQVLFGTGQTSPEAYANVDLSNGTYNDYNMVSFDTEDYGNGWYRIFGVINPLATSLGFYIASVQSKTAARAETYTGDGTSGFYLYGGQVESNSSYPTSYIPTYGTSQTRSFDDAQTNPADTIDTQSFTLFFEHKALGSTGTDWIYRLDISGTSDNISFYANSSVALNVYLGNANGGYIFGSANNDGFTIGSNSKVALSYDGNRLAYFINGSLYGSATGVSFNDANNKLIIRGVRNIINRQVAAFSTALTDSECIALTTIA